MHVTEQARVRPVLAQHRAPVAVALREPDCPKADSPLKAEVEPADTSEQRSDSQRG
jgi:hypothetical protein